MLFGFITLIGAMGLEVCYLGLFARMVFLLVFIGNHANFDVSFFVGFVGFDFFFGGLGWGFDALCSQTLFWGVLLVVGKYVGSQYSDIAGGTWVLAIFGGWERVEYGEQTQLGVFCGFDLGFTGGYFGVGLTVWC